MGILAFFSLILDVFRFSLMTVMLEIDFSYDFYYTAVTSFYFYFVEYICHERLVNLLDTLWTSDEAQMEFLFFNFKKIL